MVLIYSAIITSRLQYTCSFIFKELMQADIAITDDMEEFKQYDGVKVNYSIKRITPEELWIQNVDLLFEKGISPKLTGCFEINGYKAFFKTNEGDVPVDILAASFYLLSRYEEYLPHKKDIYGRYAHENALAFKEDFLHQPVINIWVNALAKKLLEFFPTFHFPFSIFHFLPTYDIDIAFSYKHKGFKRTIGGFLKSPSLERLKVLAGSQQDPFDSYKWMDGIHEKYSLNPIYFFLVAEKNAEYDKNILPGTNAMQQLIAVHASKYSIGVHPGWQSGEDEFKLVSEIKTLENTSQQQISKSRQHYIRFNLPEGYRRLINAGITDDYSMGYGSINGFRASVASSFYWYDLEKEEQTVLRIHPFCFMEANSFYEQHFSAQQAYDELMHYSAVCKQVGGTMITIWHNNFLGTGKQFAGWRQCYERFIRELPS